MPSARLSSDLGKLLFSKFTALLLITVLLMPLFLISGIGNVKAEKPRKTKPEAPIKNAPPEPFVIGGGTKANTFQTNLTIGIASALASSFSIFGISDQAKKEPQITTEPKEEANETRTNYVKPKRDEAEVENTDLNEMEINAEAVPLPSPPAVPFDFDEDGKSDIGRWHAANYSFNMRKSDGTGNITATVGSSSAAKVAPGDFDGDGDYDLAVFLNGTWTINGMSPISYGTTGDIPVPGFYDANTTTDAAVFRPSNSTWYVNKSGGGTITQAWGTTGDIPVVGDFDGDGLTDLSVFRPSTGYWWVMKSTGGTLSREWGLSGDVPVPADYTGDGITDIAVYRPSNGTWYVATSDSGFNTTYSQTWGNYGDQPVPADYDSDGLADMAVWRPSNGTWYIAKSGSSGALQRYELGASGDMAVPSAYLAQSAFDVPADELGKAKHEPRNETGGTNLYSQNFSWGTSLVGLPGRSGMDMSFGIGYNSLVWTKVSSAMVFDADGGGLTPGFRFGFPVIEPVFYNDETGQFTYTMIAPSGARVEFRETSVAGYYETPDGSYTQLQTIGSTDPNVAADAITIKVTTTDGTQMSYAFKGGVFKCTQIKDRNGNKIDIAYNDYGDLSTVTDTLGRVVTVNYGGNLLPSTITQTWKGTNGSGSDTTHTWATFSYTTKEIATDFDGLDVAGPPNGWDITVLEKITYADTSWTKFYYNGYTQVYKIENYADDDHKLNHVRTNLESPSADQADCPRFTETRTWAENFNMTGSPAEAQEVLVENTAPANSTYTVPGGSSQDTSVVTVSMPEHPDDLINVIHFGRTGWNQGLPVATRDCLGTCSTEKRWTWTAWTQDNTGVAYPVNPRATETRVGDGTNTKRTTIDYHLYTESTISKFGLPEYVKVYDADLSTVLKTQKTTYNLDSAYTSRRIIGLPAQTELWEGTTGGTLMAKTTYAFDESGYAGTGQSLTSATQHDTTNYGTGFAYRGNLTGVTRWDATAPTTSGSAITSSTKYNIAGSPISQTTPWDGTSSRTVTIGYTDVWNDSVSRTTYAYPTSITDPASNTSTVFYRYDIGANVSATSPAPAGQSYGKTTKRVFDDKGRLERNSIYINTTEHSYVRYEYPSNGIHSKVYATLVDVDGDTNIAEDEVLTDSWFDGAGRVRIARTPHPGSSGGWTAVKTEYDILGRAWRSTVPTEIDPDNENDPDTWVPYGDDYRGGNWLWNRQEYDWKDRVTRTIPSDSTGSDGKDTLISYAGCGCAGGMVTTIEGELVPRTDTSGNARRKQKSYTDILGRTTKTEVFQWDGTSLYTTTEQTYNGRDQVTLTKQTDKTSTASPQTHQDVTTTFDGHGRLKTRHYPIEDAEEETTWSYNPDGSVNQIIDPRGAVTDLTYNSRGLTTQVAYTPFSGGTDTPTVTFGYDNIGNRTSMDTAGVSETTYAYDSLSRMTSETVDFDDLEDNYTIGYSYQLSGKLKSVTDPFDSAATYNSDKTGRTTSITGTGFPDVSTFASGMEFRAFGAVKEMTYGSSDSSEISYEFDNRLRVVNYQATSSVLTGGFVRKAEYEYNADGKVKAVNNVLDGKFDQEYKFDHVGRMVNSSTGLVTNEQEDEVPTYSQTVGYNAFSDMTSRTTGVWGATGGFTASYVNGRKSGSDEVYDEAGNITENPTANPEIYDRWKFDASGRMTEQVSRWYQGAPQQTSFDKTQTVTSVFDGDGRIVKRTEHKLSEQVYPSGTYEDEKTEYFVRSTVLGGKVLTELDDEGEKTRTRVFAGEGVIAEQVGAVVLWKHQDIVTGSFQTINEDGTASNPFDSEFAAEFEPLGGVIPPNDPSAEEPANSTFPGSYRWGGDVQRPESGCAWNGMPIPCNILSTVLRGSFVSHIEVNERAEGGTDLYHSLRGAYTYRITETSTAVVCKPGDRSCDPSPEIDRQYELIESPIWPSHQNKEPRITTKPGLVDIKIIPRGLSESSCNFLLNQLFGNLASIAASRHEPSGLLDQSSDGGRRTHVFAGLNRATRSTDEFGRNIHVYGDATGTRTDSALYVPTNLDGTPPTYLAQYNGFTSGEYEERNTEPVNYSNRFLFGYKNGLTILVAHVAAVPNAEGARQKTLGTPFLRNGRLVGPRNMVGSFQIGYMGGPGGYSNGFYVHSHIAFWRNGVGVDPRREFCSVGGSRF